MSLKQVNNIQDYQNISLSALEKELQTLKERQKNYYKLSNKVNILQKKCKILELQSKNCQEIDNQAEQIAQLKAQIQGVAIDIKRIQSETKKIKSQIKESRNDLQISEQNLEKLKKQNFQRELKIQKKRQKLQQKYKIIEQIRQKSEQNQETIQKIRQNIKKLEYEKHQIDNQIDSIRFEKEQAAREKQKVQNIILQLKRQVSNKKDRQKELKSHLSQLSLIKTKLNQELFNLQEQESKVSKSIQKQIQIYKNSCECNSTLQNKIKIIKDQIYMAEIDVEKLVQEYIKQNQQLKQEEQLNNKINSQFDAVSKQAKQVWETICQLFKLQNQNPNFQSLRTKAYRIWTQILPVLGK